MHFRSISALALALFAVAAHGSVRTELALIPQIGYAVPHEGVQELNGVAFDFDGGASSGVAFEVRHLLGSGDRPCGFAIATEYLQYAFKSRYRFLAQERTGEATSIARILSPKLICASDNVRYSLGVGFGYVNNRVDLGDRAIVHYDAPFGQVTAAAEFGGERFRLHTGLRYLRNPDSGTSYRQYDGSGLGVFVGVSVVLRKLPGVRGESLRVPFAAAAE